MKRLKNVSKSLCLQSEWKGAHRAELVGRTQRLKSLVVLWEELMVAEAKKRCEKQSCCLEDGYGAGLNLKSERKRFKDKP